MRVTEEAAQNRRRNEASAMHEDVLIDLLRDELYTSRR